MQSKIFAFAAGMSLAAVGFGADAMPAAPIAKAPSNVQLTAGGCGPGFAPGPAGVCRRMVVRERPVVVVPARPVVRAAPCGVRVGPVGVRTPC